MDALTNATSDQDKLMGQSAQTFNQGNGAGGLGDMTDADGNSLVNHGNGSDLGLLN